MIDLLSLFSLGLTAGFGAAGLISSDHVSCWFCVLFLYNRKSKVRISKLNQCCRNELTVGYCRVIHTHGTQFKLIDLTKCNYVDSMAMQ